MAVVSRSGPGSSQTIDLIRRNPDDIYDLVQRVGSGTYGDVYKVSSSVVFSSHFQ